MAEVLTTAQMRGVERAAMAAGAVDGLGLMERAGEATVAALRARWPELGSGARRAVVLCGPGNNGGDGFVIARLLAGQGWQVAVYALGDPARLPPDAATNHARWSALGPVHPLSAPPPEAAPDLVVDALFGIGLAWPLSPEVAMALARHSAAPGLHRLAVDLPSGLDGDSGAVLGDYAFRADLTVTFHRAKPGHYLGVGPDHCGALAIGDIGLTSHEVAGPEIRRVTGPQCALAKGTGGHKYSHGHALILCGDVGRTGAARLAARAALRVGAGLVTLAPPLAAEAEVAAQITAIMLRRVEDGAALSDLLADRRINALCLGPGLGVARAAALLPAALGAGRPTVLDADALSAIAADPGLFELVHEDCVMTPHAGEFARLFPDLAAAEGSALSLCRRAAERAGCVVLLKGAATVIAAPSGRLGLHAAVYEASAPWLATAGSGDVLAGLITGLLARGIGGMAASETAAWLHAAAARRFGPGLIAEDLTEALPGVLRDLALG